jgi:hypothetical protein
MAAHGARRLAPDDRQSRSSSASRLLCAAQGVEFRAPLETSPAAAEGAGRAARNIAALEDRPLHGADHRRPRRAGREGLVLAAVCRPCSARERVMSPVEVTAATARWCSACRIPAPSARRDPRRLNETGQRAGRHRLACRPRSMTGCCPTRHHRARHLHRYVIDANRDPSGAASIPAEHHRPGARHRFRRPPIYREGRSRTARSRSARRLPRALSRRAEAPNWSGCAPITAFAMLYDCHSIRSHIPFLFEGTLPDFNIGTNNGETCARSSKRGRRSAARRKAIPRC